MKNNYRHNDDGSTTIFIESPKYGTKEILIDTDDFEKLSEEYPSTWTLRVPPSEKDNSKNMRLYAVQGIPHPNGGFRLDTDGATRSRTAIKFLHHAINGKPAKGYVTDHINGNGLDNRKKNLRFVTQAVNNQNKKKYSNNTHGYVGVRKAKKQVIVSSWYAEFGGSDNRTYLGTFPTKEEAAQAYDLAVVEHRKIINPERQLNFPEKLEEYKALLSAQDQ